MNRPTQPRTVPGRNILTFFSVLGLSCGIVAAISIFTNHMIPAWDLTYYIDMAKNGLRGNHNLAAPFAYRFALPLLVGAVARAFHITAEMAFDRLGFVACIFFALCCFYFARAYGSSIRTAMMISSVLCCYYFTVKWQLFAGAMLDIYAFPLILGAFWLLMKRRYGACLVLSSLGLLFKEWFLVPLATQAILHFHQSFRKNRSRALSWAGLTLVALIFFFACPRLLIHVSQTFQDVDPLNDPSTVKRLIRYPLSWHHDFNIIFSYLAFYLPLLLLATRSRAVLIWNEMKKYGWLVPIYLFFHFLLVMYGGWNIPIFVIYTLPVEIIALSVLWKEGQIKSWETALILPVIIIFNRLWTTHVQPTLGVDSFIDYYGGYYMHVSIRSVERMVEVLLWIAAFAAIRYLINFRGRPRAGRSHNMFITTSADTRLHAASTLPPLRSKVNGTLSAE